MKSNIRCFNAKCPTFASVQPLQMSKCPTFANVQVLHHYPYAVGTLSTEILVCLVNDKLLANFVKFYQNII